MGYIVRMWSKPDTQAFMKRLREAGYDVRKDSAGRYSAWHLEGMAGGDALVFSALNGSRGYLCRINSDYVKETENSRDIIPAPKVA